MRCQVELEALVERHAQQPDGSAAQCKGIARARGLLADREDAGHGVEAIGNRQRRAGRCRGQFIARAARQVMLAYRNGDGRRHAVGACVVLAHHALQFRELADHRGQEVALAEPGSAGDFRWRGADHRRQCRGERSDALGLGAERTELHLEGDAIERTQLLFQRRAPILLPEESRVSEARAHHALVAGAHHGRIAALDVAHGDEVRQQRTRRRFHREVALVILERRDQHFARQGQEALLELPGDRHRPFDQRGHLIEQLRRDDRAAAQGLRRGGDPGAHALAACGKIGLHLAARFERALVTGGRAQWQLAGRMKTMAARRAAGRGVENRRRHHFTAEQHDHPVHGAHELRFARAPAHALRHRQRSQRFGDDARQQLCGRSTGFGAAVPQAFVALLVALASELFKRHAATAGKGLRGARRRAGGIEGGAQRRAATADLLVSLLQRESAHAHREAARRRERFHLAMAQTRFGQPRDDAFAQRLLERGQGLGRQFLGAELEQEIAPPGAARGHHAFTAAGRSGKPCASRLA